jgi:hypothetical protein
MQEVALRKRNEGNLPERTVMVKNILAYLVHEIGVRQDLVEKKEVSGGVQMRVEHEIDIFHDVITWVNKNNGTRSTIISGNKLCSKCKQILPIDSFGNDKYSWDGHNGQCKTCRNKKGGKRS